MLTNFVSNLSRLLFNLTLALIKIWGSDRVVKGQRSKALPGSQSAPFQVPRLYRLLTSGVASPKKLGGPKIFLLVSSKKLQCTCMGPPYT